MNTRERVLKEALNCVNGEREKQYGNPEDNFRRIADLWSVYLTSLFEDEKIVIDIDPIDVAKMMILFKIARSNGDKDKLDNYIDILGYGACAAEIFESSEKAEQVLKKKEELGVQLAKECKDCDYAKKCIGTGICLKEKEEKCVKNGEKILDNFADLVNERVRKKTEEKSLKEKGDKNSIASFWNSYNKVLTHIILASEVANVDLFDVVDRLIRDEHDPIEMTVQLMIGKLALDTVIHYVEDAIHEVKNGYK